jgi:hypothetical protein
MVGLGRSVTDPSVIDHHARWIDTDRRTRKLDVLGYTPAPTAAA